jgi:hypothetical protein
MIVSLRVPWTSPVVPMPPKSGEFGSLLARLSEPTSRKFSTVDDDALRSAARSGTRWTVSIVARVATNTPPRLTAATATVIIMNGNSRR